MSRRPVHQPALWSPYPPGHLLAQPVSTSLCHLFQEAFLMRGVLWSEGRCVPGCVSCEQCCLWVIIAGLALCFWPPVCPLRPCPLIFSSQPGRCQIRSVRFLSGVWLSQRLLQRLLGISPVPLDSSSWKLSCTCSFCLEGPFLPTPTGLPDFVHIHPKLN